MRRSTWAEDRHTFNMVIFKGPNIEEVTKDQKGSQRTDNFSGFPPLQPVPYRVYF